MKATIHIRKYHTGLDETFTFDKIHNFHQYGEYCEFDVDPDCVQSDNVSPFDDSSEPWHKEFYCVVECHIED